MKTWSLNSKDFWSGMMFIATGAGALIIARDYPFGTTVRMGPGYFPIVLGALLVLFGLYFVGKGLRGAEKIEGSWSRRGMIILPLSLVLFGILMERAGFVPALVVLIVGSALASTEFRLVEVLIFAVLLTAACVALFVWGLGLPYPLIVGL
jgi:hypothetical protein